MSKKAGERRCLSRVGFFVLIDSAFTARTPLTSPAGAPVPRPVTFSKPPCSGSSPQVCRVVSRTRDRAGSSVQDPASWPSPSRACSCASVSFASVGFASGGGPDGVAMSLSFSGLQSPGVRERKAFRGIGVEIGRERAPLTRDGSASPGGDGLLVGEDAGGAVGADGGPAGNVGAGLLGGLHPVPAGQVG